MPKHQLRHKRERLDVLPFGAYNESFEPAVRNGKRHRHPGAEEAPGAVVSIYLPASSVYPYGGTVVPLDSFLDGSYSWGCIRSVFIRYEDMFPVDEYPVGTIYRCQLQNIDP
jgi:hypothetical protein